MRDKLKVKKGCNKMADSLCVSYKRADFIAKKGQKANEKHNTVSDVLKEIWDDEELSDGEVLSMAVAIGGFIELKRQRDMAREKLSSLKGLLEELESKGKSDKDTDESDMTFEVK